MKDNKLPYPIFVSDEPEDKHYAMMYDGTTEVLVSREHFSEKAGVFKLPCEWLVYDPAYAKTGCGQVTIHQYGYKYCPYCGREIKFTQKEE